MKKKSSYIKLEESRNRRLWLVQIGIPVLTTIGMLYSQPDIRWGVNRKCRDLKYKVSDTIRKGKEKLNKKKEK